MKKHEITFSLVKAPLEFCIIFLSFYISRDIRLVVDFIPALSLPVQVIWDIELLPFAISWAFIYVLIFLISKLYFITISTSKIKEYLSVIKYSIYWFIIFSFLVYFSEDFLYIKEIPRLVIIYTFFIWTFFVLFSRFILNYIQSELLENWFLPKKKLLIISDKSKNKIKYILDDIKEAKIYDIYGYIWWKKLDLDCKYFWNYEELKAIIRSYEIDEILYIGSDFTKKEMYSILELSKIYGIRYRYLTNSFDISNNNTWVSLMSKIMLVELKNTSLDYFSRVVKRVTDLFVSFFSLIILSPLFLIIWILIKIEDPSWPIFYKNRRIWKNWKEFNLYKFRYMKWEYCIKDSYWIWKDEDEALKFENKLIQKSSKRKWPLYKIDNDPRKTNIWNFIEKYSIDEFPQFINVLIGNMSIVWPRPHQPREVEKYTETQRRVLTLKPWITWMAQVNWREHNTFEKEVSLDIFYIENWSFLLDAKIFLKTFYVMLFRK